MYICLSFNVMASDTCLIHIDTSYHKYYQDKTYEEGIRAIENCLANSKVDDPELQFLQVTLWARKIEFLNAMKSDVNIAAVNDSMILLADELFIQDPFHKMRSYYYSAKLHKMSGAVYKSKERYDQAIAISKNISKQDSTTRHLIALVYLENGLHNLNLINYQKALQSFLKAEEILGVDLNDQYKYAYSFHLNLANVYGGLNNKEKALFHLKKAKNIAMSVYGEHSIAHAKSLKNLAKHHANNFDYSQSITYAKEAVVISESLNYNPIHAYNMLGYCYGKFDTEAAIRANLKAIDLYKNGVEGYIINVYYNLAYEYKKFNQLDKAESTMKELYGILQETSDVPNHTKLDINGVLADFAFSDKDRNKFSFHKNIIDSIFHHEVGLELSILNYEDLRRVLDYYTLKLQLIHWDTSAIDRKASLQMQDTIAKTLNLIFKQKSFVDHFASNARTFYEPMISDWYHLGKEEEKMNYDEIFRLFEIIKNLGLADLMSSYQLSEMDSNNKALVEKEREIKYHLDLIHDKKIDDAFTLQELEKYQSALEQVHGEFYQSNPIYFQEDKDLCKMSLEAIAKDEFLEDGTIIYYQYNRMDSVVYAFCINKNESHLIPLASTNSIDENIDALRKSLFFNKEENTSAKYAYKLYQQIFEPIVSQLNVKDNIAIIADQKMGFISFDMLIDQMPDHKEAFKNYAYLIHKYNFSYQYSMQLWDNMKRLKRSPYNNGLAMAPEFLSNELITLNDRANLGPLLHSKKEIQSIANYFNFQLLQDSEANKEQFLAKAKEASIIHLATHSKADEQEGKRSFIAFSGASEGADGEKLMAEDIYHLNLQADMVVLSACESGIGELNYGNGIIGITQGFTFAGAKSIISSLWNVNDESTSKIMKLFYQYLSEGLRKDEALRKAKLQYLEQANHKSAKPYYWAAFIPFGDMVELQKPPYTLYSGIGFLGLVAIAFFARRMKLSA